MGGVNQAGISVKDYVLNRGGLTDAVATEINSKPRSKACREKSAEVIVCLATSLPRKARKAGLLTRAEGLNPTEV